MTTLILKSAKGTTWKHHKWIARVLLPNGEWKRIYPKDEHVDKDGNFTGGQAEVREAINDALFGEYGFHPAGHKKAGEFWKKKGILFDYRTRTRGDKVVVEPVKLVEGYTAFDFRDGSVARAYGKGLPKKITEHQVPSKVIDEATGESLKEPLPVKPDVDEPGMAGTSDIPIEEKEAFRVAPPRKPETQVALDAPLDSDEDPLALTDAYLGAFLSARKPSRATTPEGQAKARAERKGQFDEIVGKRRVKPLPAWAVNKFDNAEHLEHELSRDGRPITTLITLGLWNKDLNNKRAKEQLEKEWRSTISYHVRRAAKAFELTDEYRKATKDDEDLGLESYSEGSYRKSYLRSKLGDLYQMANQVLIEEADKYKSNDEPHGSYSRFDKRANSAIMTELYTWSREKAMEDGATGIISEEMAEVYAAKQGPTYVITPEEHYELTQYGPLARKFIDEALADLPAEQRSVFQSRLWFDDEHTGTEGSDERKFNEARLKQQEKVGRSAVHWGRPWTRTGDAGVPSISDKLADTSIAMRDGSSKKLKELGAQHQAYYLKQWYDAAREHMLSKMRTSDGKLTAQGAVVQRWLQLEAKLANVNRRIITERTEHPLIQMPPVATGRGVGRSREGMHRGEDPVLAKLRTEHVASRPEVRFFRTPGSNQELGERLGILRRESGPKGQSTYSDKFDVQLTPGITAPAPAQRHLEAAKKYHNLVQASRRVKDIDAVISGAKKDAKAAADIGHWTTSASGSAEWAETDGVTALHRAAHQLNQVRGTDDKAKLSSAVAEFTRLANRVGQHLPEMAEEYKRRLGSSAATFTPEDLVQWKVRAQQNHKHHQDRIVVLDFERKRRAKKSLRVSDLAKALDIYNEALGQLYSVLVA